MVFESCSAQLKPFTVEQNYFSYGCAIYLHGPESGKICRWTGTEMKRWRRGFSSSPLTAFYVAAREVEMPVCVHHTGALLNSQLHSHSHCPYGSVYSWVLAHVFVCAVESVCCSKSFKVYSHQMLNKMSESSHSKIKANCMLIHF